MKEIQLEEMWGKINKALTSENKTFLESKTAKILPNNPTSQGFSADQIRRSLYEGILVLFEWLKTTNNSNVDFNNKVMETLTAITENNEEDKQDLANLKQSLIDGTFNVKYLTWAIMATNDENGNRIIDTYATIERLTQVLEALTQEISDRKAADDLEKKERKEETSAIINSVNQEISDRTNAVSVLNNLITAETENRTSEDEKVLQYAQSVNEALGNAKTDLQGKIDSEAQTRLANDNEIKASITSKEDSLKTLINSVKTELNGSITTLNNRVNNLPTNYVFDTYESMTNDLLNASNTKYKVGDTLFIKEVNKPDYWVSAILSTKGTYGYYELSEQESKVDLSNYVKISELSREAIEEKFLETVENGRTKSFAARSFAATSRNSGIDVNNYAEYGYDGVSFHKNGMEYPLGFPEKDGVFALTSDIPQTLKNPFALTINGKVYDGSSAVSITTETITEHDFVMFWHAGIEIQNDGSEHVLRLSDFDTELEEFSPHISCQYDGPQYYWVWKFPQISGTFAMESQIPTKLSQLTNDGNYQTNTSDLKDNTTTFTTASTRSNVASGEKLSVSFGKIAKYFNDLKAVAFSGNKADIGLGNVDNTADKDKNVKYANSAGSVAWDNVSGKPNSFTPSSHTHEINDVTGLQGELDGKADKDHTHSEYVDKTSRQEINGLKRFNDGVALKRDDTGIFSDDDVSVCVKSFSRFVYLKGKNGGSEYTYNARIGIPFNVSNFEYELPSKSGTIALTSDLDPIKNDLVANEYNLGYYDTITANSDGTYTITRQTGYITLDGVKHKFTEKGGTTNNGLFYCPDTKNYITKPSSNGDIGYVTSNLAPTTSQDSLHRNNIYAIAVYTTGSLAVGLTTAITTIDKANAYLVQNPISIQYKLATPYTEKVEKNHYARYNERFILEHNKSEAERSANLFDYDNAEWVNDVSLSTQIGNTWNNSGSKVSTFIKVEPNKTYYIQNCAVICCYNSNKDYLNQSFYINYYSVNNFSFTTPSNCAYIRIDTKTSITQIMLNEGTKPLPYQPYEGKVVHEKELESITPGIFTKLGNKTNFSFDSGSYLVVANNGLVTVTGTDPLNVGSSANKKFVGIFMVTIAGYGGGQSVCVNTEEVFLGEAASATISGPMFTIYKLN